MPAASRLRLFYLTYLLKPAAERTLHREIDRRQVRRIVELGLGDGTRAERMIEVAQRHARAAEIHYAGIDLFEDRPSGPALMLKQAFRRLRPLGTRLQLVPGDPLAALSRMANSLPQTDLLLIAADQDAAALEQAWYFVPRMLHANSLVLREVVQDGKPQYQSVTPRQIEQFAAIRHRRPMRRAA